MSGLVEEGLRVEALNEIKAIGHFTYLIRLDSPKLSVRIAGKLLRHTHRDRLGDI